jgi:hypothetical protein
MANYAKAAAEHGNYEGGSYTFLIFNTASHLVGKMLVKRTPTNHRTNIVPAVGGGGTCPAPNSSQQAAPEKYCPPRYNTAVTALTATVGAMRDLFHAIVPADFGPTNIPTNISNSCPGTSGKKTAVANFLHQHYLGTTLTKGETGFAVFADGSKTVFKVVNAGSHQFAMIDGGNYGPQGKVLKNNCGAYAAQPNPENTPTLNLGRVGPFSSVKIGGGIGASDLGGFFNSNVRFFYRQTKDLPHFGTGSNIVVP